MTFTRPIPQSRVRLIVFNVKIVLTGAYTFMYALEFLFALRTFLSCYTVVNLRRATQKLALPAGAKLAVRVQISRLDPNGGLKWTRTTDLTLIRRVL